MKKITDQQMEELFTIFNSIEGAVYVADMDTYKILAVNKYCEDHYGPGLVGEICYEKLQKNQSSPCSFCTNHLLVGDDGRPSPPVVWEFQNTKTREWYHCTDRAIPWPTGRLARMEIAVNITERKLAEEMMWTNKDQLTKRVKELHCLYAISLIIENQESSFEEVLQGIVDLIPPAWQYPEITCARIIIDGEEFKTNNFMETPWSMASDIIINGEPGGVLEVNYMEERPEIYEGPFQEEERNLINAVSRRLGRTTEHFKAEKSLRESEKRFRDLVENSLVGILIVQDGLIVYGNPEQERLLGHLLRSSRLTESFNIHEEDIERVNDFYHRILSGKQKAGSIEFRFYPPMGADEKHRIKWVYCTTNLIEYLGSDAILVNMMDVSRVKELEHLLRIQDKMTSLGHVAAGIAHEIRNPLSGINIYLSTLEKIFEKTGGLEKAVEIVKQIKSASSKIESVIRRVMDFSKPGEPKFVLTDINKSVREAIDLSAVTLRKRGIKIEKTLEEDLSQCYADPHLIEEVILNLITNAAEAMKRMEGEKKIVLTSSVKDCRIVIKVSDSGSGVHPGIRDKIFDPFYSTKESNTGIGLSIVQRIVFDHGGSLDISTSEWGGAEFTVEIPLEKKREGR